MSEVFQEDIKFDAAEVAADEGASLCLNIDGYEGPLHVLLELARQQKVDLARISILELAEQYIDFIKNAQDLRIELAADYLVMAAWLAYLKSRLILPREGDHDILPEGDDLAVHLAFRLQRLEAMRRAADGLFRLPQMGQTVYKHGLATGLCSRLTPLYTAGLFDILKAYGESRSKASIRNHKVSKPLVFALEEARHRLKRAVMALDKRRKQWMQLDSLLPQETEFEQPIPLESIRASSFLAGLELAKEGDLELRQSGSFQPIYVRGAAS